MQRQKIQEDTIEEQSVVNKALLVEDDNICQKVLCYYLSELGYQIEIAEDAETAIQLINNKIYTLILIDLGLPDQLGEKVIQVVQTSSFNQFTPLIVCTAHADQKKKQQHLTLGAKEVLIKPILKETLQETLFNLGCFCRAYT